MALLPAAPAIVRAAISRAVQLNLSAGSVTRALNRAGYSVRGLGVPGRFRVATAQRAARETIAALRGNAKPRLGRGMTGRPHKTLTRYSYVGDVVFRLPDGTRVTRTLTALSNELLTKAQAGRLLAAQAARDLNLVRLSDTLTGLEEATVEQGVLTDAFANVA